MSFEATVEANKRRFAVRSAAGHSVMMKMASARPGAIVPLTRDEMKALRSGECQPLQPPPYEGEAL